MNRIGSGFDVHAFSGGAGRPLVLAGTTIGDGPGLAGHSDADVVCHAVSDALLGAVALGDLGTAFGTDDPALEGASSLTLLTQVAARIAEGGWAVGNLDCTVVAERPRLATHQPAMRSRLAAALDVSEDRVSVKVTSTDGLGSIGRGEGIACWATVMLVPGV